MDIQYNELINAILVNEGVRPACMLQYHGNEINNPKAISFLDTIKYYFPNLIQTQTNHGLVISKHTVKSVQTDEEIGRTIGYPAVDEYKKLDLQKTSYTLSLMSHITLENKSVESIQIFANVAMDPNPYIYDFMNIKDKAEIALNSRNAIEVLSEEYVKKSGLIVTSVEVQFKIEGIINVKDMVTRLSKDLIPNEYEIVHINSILEYISKDMCLNFIKNLDYNNKIHVGIIIVILLHYDNDEQFSFPFAQFDEIREKTTFERDGFIERLTWYLIDRNLQETIEEYENDISSFLDDEHVTIFREMYQFYNPYHIGMIAALIANKIVKVDLSDFHTYKTRDKLQKIKTNFTNEFKRIMLASKINDD